MSVLHFPTASPVPVARSVASAALGRLWSRTVEAWRLHKADRAMHELSDEILHDIGVARSEIADVTRHGRARR